MILSSSPRLGKAFADLGEALKALEGAEEPALLAFEEAWSRAEEVFEFLEGKGLNPFAVDLLDLKAEAELAAGAFSTEAIASARHKRLLSSPAMLAPVRVGLGKRVSRRALLSRPLSAIAYVNAPLIDAETCNVLDRCQLCVESCPHGALSGKPPQVDYDKCTMCGLCIALCPIEAIATPSVSTDALEEFARELRSQSGSPAHLLIAPLRLLREVPREGAKPTVVLPVTRAEELSPLDLLRLAHRGFRPLLLSEGFGEVRKVYENLSAVVDLASSPSEAGELLRRPVELADKGEQRSYRGFVRELLAEGELLFPGYADVEVEEQACTLCEACARYCPTGALRVERRGDSMELLLVRDECIGCRKCQQVCPEGAIRRVPWLLSSPAERLLASSLIAKCIRCGAELASERIIAAVERRLRAAGAEQALKSLRLCPVCKAEALFD
ncbi:MAG: 4Fe-4S binding protein [Acidilobaceae archaeon]|nr:4Fe-4S binding protein [Acidilobaceae archaeon]